MMKKKSIVVVLFLALSCGSFRPAESLTEKEKQLVWSGVFVGAGVVFCIQNLCWYLASPDTMFFGSKIEQSEEELWITACHEAGHTLMAVLGGVDVTSVSIIPGSEHLGVTYLDKPDKMEGNKSKLYFLKEIMVDLGGPCAEEIAVDGIADPDCITAGVSGDLESALYRACYMVEGYGMGGGRSFLMTQPEWSHASEESKSMFYAAKISILNRCKQAARLLLERYHDTHRALSQALLEKQELTQEEIYDITGEPRDEASEVLKLFRDDVS